MYKLFEIRKIMIFFKNSIIFPKLNSVPIMLSINMVYKLKWFIFLCNFRDTARYSSFNHLRVTPIPNGVCFSEHELMPSVQHPALSRVHTAQGHRNDAG